MSNWIAKRTRRKRNAHNLYGSIVTLARARVLYAGMGAPDTVESRFELLVFHLFACLGSLKRSSGEKKYVAQYLVDKFFADMDTTSRELGVGDTAVPKRMRQIAAVFEERMTLYKEAAENKNKNALVAALAENVFGSSYDAAMMQDLTSYVRELQQSLSRTPITDLEAGRICVLDEAMFENDSINESVT